MSLVRVVLIGCPGVGKHSLVKAVMKDKSDGDVSEYDEPDVDQVAVIKGQRTLLECQEVSPQEDEQPDDPRAPLVSKGGGFFGAGKNSSARLNRSKAPIKKHHGPKLRTKPNLFDRANQQKADKQKEKTTKGGGLSSQWPTSYVVVFDIGSVQSFEEAEREMEQLAGAGKSVLLVGNKTDKARRYRRITYEEGLKLSTRMPAAEIKYIESSAKLGMNVDLIFETAVGKLQGSQTAQGGNAELSNNNTQADPSSPEEGGEAEESLDETGVPSNCCARNCRCCPRPIYTKLKKCGKCCTIM